MKRLWMTKSLPHVKQICLPSVISNVINNKNGVGKFVRLTNEKKKKRKTEDTILQSVSIFTFLHHCLHLYLLCFLYLILMFWEVIFVWLNLLAVPALLILINCPHDAAFLNSVLFWRCWELQGAEVAEPHRTVFFFHLPGPNVRLVISLFYNPWRVRVETSYWGFVNFRMRVKLTKISLVRNIQISSAQIALKSKRLSLHTQYSGAWAKTTTMAVKTSLKNMNLPPFKLYRAYLHPLNLSNVGDSSWSWILKDFVQVQKETGKFVVVCSRPS